MGEPDRFQLQDDEYDFPYHHLMGFEPRAGVFLHRQVDWGLAYLTYVSFITQLLKERSVRSLLSVGCGDGRLASLMSSFVPHITGVDLSQRAVQFARAFNPGIEFVCGDVADIPGQYHALTLIEVLEHIPDEILPGFIGHCAGKVTSDGFVLISVPTVHVAVSPKHFRHYTLELLQSQLSPHLQIEQHWWLYRKGIMQKILRAMLRNKMATLNWPPARRMVWALHRKLTYHADSGSGYHLIAVCKPV
jgi:2-polyprenyl-3-methyl-5-hydroxy-6-metoxy-1,4-benzoquinol methylase